MILTKEEQCQPYVDAGLWGDNPQEHSLDGILRTNARDNADAIAFSDAPNRSLWTSGDSRSLTCSALDHEVTIMATFIKGLGLSNDTVVALYGPNTVDMVLSLLAINRAGLIAAPMPLFWRELEMSNYLTEIQARAIFTVDRIEEDAPALRCRDLTQSLFSIKYILGFGDNLPDGVVSLDQILPAVSQMLNEEVDKEVTFEPINPDAVITLHPASLQSRETEIALPRTSNQWLSTERAIFDVIDDAKHSLSPFALSGALGFCTGIVRTLKHKGRVSFHHFQTENTLAAHIDLIKPDMVLLPQHLAASQLDRLSSNTFTTLGCVWKNNHLAQMPITQSDDTHTVFDISILNEVAAIGQLRPLGSDSPSPLPLSDDIRDISLRLRKPSNDKLEKQSQLAGGELIAVGASAPEALFPSNSEERALSRLRNKTLHEGARTHVGCRLKQDDLTQCEPIGFLIDTIHRSTQVTTTTELDSLYKSMPNIIDAAHFIDPATNNLNLAVVMHGPIPTAEEFGKSLTQMGVSHLKIPHAIFETNEIKRGVGGVVIRHELVALLEQSKSRKVMEDRQQAAI